MELKFEKMGSTFSVPDVDKLPAESIAYLLNYGYQQSMQDCIAGAAKAVAVELADTAKKANKPLPSDAELAQATRDTVLGLLGKRHDAIVAGEVGIRQIGQRDPVLSLAREEIWTALRKPENADKAKAIRAMEKEARNAKITELATAHKAKHQARLEAEVKRRAEAGGEIEVEL